MFIPTFNEFEVLQILKHEKSIFQCHKRQFEKNLKMTSITCTLFQAMIFHEYAKFLFIKIIEFII